MNYTLNQSGREVIEAALKKAVKADVKDAPFPLSDRDAKIWHEAQASAYQHSLEMMVVTEK